MSEDWQIDELKSVYDGDTIRANISRTEILTIVPGWVEIRTIENEDTEKGTPLRLIILNTPEMNRDPVNAKIARDQLKAWLASYAGRLRVETYETAGWDRLLADVYVEDDRGNTASQYMLQQGWLPYITTRDMQDGVAHD